LAVLIAVVSTVTVFEDEPACNTPEYAEFDAAAFAAATLPVPHGKLLELPTIGTPGVLPSVWSTNDTHLLLARLPSYVSCRPATRAVEPSVKCVMEWEARDRILEILTRM
jgi:hypothetical protein